MTIDDILDKALSPEHSRMGGQLQEYISNLHIPKLLEFFKQGLTGAERTRFAALPIDQQIAELQNQHYMLKPDQADQFVDYLSATILNKVSAPWAPSLKQR